MPLLLKNGSFGGEGGSALSRDIADSRFVLIGETHFTREIPEFTDAVCQIMHPDAYAVEAGPLAAAYVENESHDPRRIEATKSQLSLASDSIAFLNLRDENDLASSCAGASQARPFHLWGLDQEYVGSAGVLLKAMQDTHPGAMSLAAIRVAQEHAEVSEHKAAETGKVTDLYLIAIPDADLRQLTSAVNTDGTAKTMRLLKEFRRSHDIYQMSMAGSPESNHARAVLLKQHFMAEYLPLHATAPQARVLFKFGSMHMGRGFDPLHQLNLGNAVAEVADAEGVRSLHISILGAAGVGASTGPYRKPMQTGAFDLVHDKEQASWLAPAMEELFPDNDSSGGSTLTMFDLRKLRFRPLHLPPEWEQLVYSYDLLIIVPKVSPATPL